MNKDHIHCLLAWRSIQKTDCAETTETQKERERERDTHTHTHTEVAVMVLVRRIPLIKFPNRRGLPPISAILSSGMFSHQETGFSWIVFDSDLYCFTSLEVSVSKYPSTLISLEIVYIPRCLPWWWWCMSRRISSAACSIVSSILCWCEDWCISNSCRRHIRKPVIPDHSSISLRNRGYLGNLSLSRVQFIGDVTHRASFKHTSILLVLGVPCWRISA